MNTHPKISIVTPSFNQGSFLEETIQSVLNQNYPNLEYIIIDGGSTDNSVEIIKKYENQLAYWVSEKDRGQSHALNKGFKRATGEIIGWLNSDDTYLPNCFNYVVKTFNKKPDVDMVYGDFILTDIKNNPLRVKREFNTFNFHRLIYKDFVGQPAAFFRCNILDRVGYLDETLRYSMDWEYFLRIGRQGKVIHIPGVLATYRLHPNAKTAEYGNEDYRRVRRIVFEKYATPHYTNKIFNLLYHKCFSFYYALFRACLVLRNNPIHYFQYLRYSGRI